MMRMRSNTLEFPSAWERIYNTNFKVVEFDHFKSKVGLITQMTSLIDHQSMKKLGTRNNITEGGGK